MDNNDKQFEIMMKLLEDVSGIRSDIKNVESLIKDQKDEVKELTNRVNELERSKSKLIGVFSVITLLISVAITFLKSMIGGH